MQRPFSGYGGESKSVVAWFQHRFKKFFVVARRKSMLAVMRGGGIETKSHFGYRRNLKNHNSVSERTQTESECSSESNSYGLLDLLPATGVSGDGGDGHSHNAANFDATEPTRSPQVLAALHECTEEDSAGFISGSPRPRSRTRAHSLPAAWTWTWANVAPRSGADDNRDDVLMRRGMWRSGVGGDRVSPIPNTLRNPDFDEGGRDQRVRRHSICTPYSFLSTLSSDSSRHCASYFQEGDQFEELNEQSMRAFFAFDYPRFLQHWRPNEKTGKEVAECDSKPPDHVAEVTEVIQPSSEAQSTVHTLPTEFEAKSPTVIRASTPAGTGDGTGSETKLRSILSPAPGGLIDFGLPNYFDDVGCYLDLELAFPAPPTPTFGPIPSRPASSSTFTTATALHRAGEANLLDLRHNTRRSLITNQPPPSKPQTRASSTPSLTYSPSVSSTEDESSTPGSRSTLGLGSGSISASDSDDESTLCTSFVASQNGTPPPSPGRTRHRDREGGQEADALTANFSLIKSDLSLLDTNFQLLEADLAVIQLELELLKRMLTN